MAKVIDGKTIAAKVKAEVLSEATRFLEQAGRKPELHVVLVGDDPASAVYVRNKEREAERCGIAGQVHRLPQEASEAEVLELVSQLNSQSEVDGLLVQFPVPPAISQAKVIAAISPAKDVDGLHAENVGRLWSGLPGLVSCTPAGCMRMLDEAGVKLEGARALVVGRSQLVGKPIAALLLERSATVTLAHSKTADLKARCLEAEVLIAAVGRPEMIRGDWIRPGATVIDVGINRRADGSLCGDVCFAEAEGVAGQITPVPGGVGLLTVAMLLKNTVQAAFARLG